MIPARRSVDRKYVVCGACRRSLCRRDRLVRAGAKEAGHYLAWEDGWRVVGEHIEMVPSARERLAEGWKPSRHDWSDGERIALSRLLLTFPPALCPGCGTLNSIDPVRLDVQGIAPHG
jgi:hypothetical protein